MKAFVMAGGKATRFKVPVEKALLEVGGRTLLERSVDALRGGGLDDICVTVTRRTPKTKELAKRVGASAVETDGRSYHDDVIRLLENEKEFVTLNVDVPFIQAEDLRMLLDRRGEGSVTAVVPAEAALRRPSSDSLMLSPDGEEMVWVGLNIVTPKEDICLLVLGDPLLTINISDEDDLAYASIVAEEHGR